MMDFCDSYVHLKPETIYVEENIPTKETEEQFCEEFSEGCACIDMCSEPHCDCIRKSGAYYKNELQTITIRDPRKPIYECNSNCKCKKDKCTQRLVQFGPRTGLKIISCDNMMRNTKGMGLSTEMKIRQGTFICEYAGEVITQSEANKRFKMNEEAGAMNYIFCINERVADQNLLTYIDPSKFGNIGRYINHSCEPNCQLFPIRINSIVPKLCIFAQKDIQENTELTFDYGSGTLGFEPKEDTLKMKECLCLAENCRKYLPFCKELATS